MSELRTVVSAFLATCLLSVGAFALGTEVDLPRYPSISPDGKQVVFSWRGDLWLVGADGGEARRLTVHPGIDSRSAWSPDGSEIAFESDRDGFVEPVRGVSSVLLRVRARNDISSE